MIHSVTGAPQLSPITAGATSVQPAAKSASPSHSSAPSQTPSSTGHVVDTVHISSAAQAALKEALETPADTAKEALGGDHQAQRLLAKEAAEKQ